MRGIDMGGHRHVSSLTPDRWLLLLGARAHLMLYSRMLARFEDAEDDVTPVRQSI